ATEGHDRTVCLAYGVDIGAVGADDDRMNAAQAEVVPALLLDVDETESAGCGVASEGADRVLVAARDVEVGAVGTARQPERARDVEVDAIGAEGERTGEREPVDAVDAVFQRLREGQRPGCCVALKYVDRIVVTTGGIDLAAVRADDHRQHSGEAGDAVDAFL